MRRPLRRPSRRPVRVRIAAAALLAPLALVACGSEEAPLRVENGSDVDGEEPGEAGSEPLPVESQNPLPEPTD